MNNIDVSGGTRLVTVGRLEKLAICPQLKGLPIAYDRGTSRESAPPSIPLRPMHERDA